MNELVERLRKKDFPVIFKFDDLKRLKFNERMLCDLFDEAVEKKCIDNIYENMYTLNIKYAKALVSEGVIA